MSAVYYKDKVRIVTAELTYAAALQFNADFDAYRAAHYQPDDPTSAQDIIRFINDEMLLRSTRSIAVRSAPDAKWEDIPAGQSRVVEVDDGEVYTLTMPVNTDDLKNVLQALPVSVASNWVENAKLDNSRIAETSFLAWLKGLMPVTTTAPAPDKPESSEPPPKRRKSTTGETTADTASIVSGDSSETSAP